MEHGDHKELACTKDYKVVEKHECDNKKLQAYTRDSKVANHEVSANIKGEHAVDLHQR